MRLAAFFMFVGLLQLQASTAYSQAQLSLNYEASTVDVILSEIESQSEFKFFYNTSALDLKRKIAIDVSDRDIESVLKEIFAGTSTAYVISDNTVVLTSKKSVVDMLNQQSEKSVSILVKDSAGEPLPGVAVLIKGTTKGGITNNDGELTLTKIEGTETLVISFIGMGTQEVAISGKGKIAVTMEQELTTLTEVVAIGYGTQKRVNLTGAVASVNMEEIAASRPITNISSALAGVAPGLTVTSNNNRPSENGNASVLVRGQGTLNNSAPLVIIDGVEGSLGSVNPQDVEAVSILKDAASASIYGSRAANGVILVTTKRGKSGKVMFDYAGQVSFQSVGKTINLLTDYATYMEIYNEGKANSGQGAQFSQEKIDEWRADGGKDPLKYPNNDWQEEVFSNGTLNQHNISASGGSDKVHFYGSLNYLNNEGIVENTGFKKISIRSNIESDVTEWFRFGIQINGYTSETEMGSDQLSTVFGYAGASTPGMVFRAPDGRFGTINNPEDDPQANNVVRYLYLKEGEDKTNSVKSRIYATVMPIDGLTIQGSYVYDFFDRKQTEKPNFIPAWDFYTNTMVTDGVERSYIKNKNWNTYRNFMDGFVKYERNFVDDRLTSSILVGASQEQYRSDNFSAFRYDLIDPSLGVIDGAIGESSASGSQTEWAMQSAFGRLNTGWDGKYLLEFNLRSDSSSRFLKDNRRGYFPSVSAGWRISEEEFMTDINWLDNLKLRGSYGSLGNNSVDNYESIPVYSQKNYVLNNALVMGLAQTSISNANLTWESTYMTDIGVDFTLLEGKVTGTVDYFNKITKDILIDLPAPDVHGTATIPKQNAAEVSNKGVEFMLTYNGTIGDEFRYNVSGNVTYIKNQVEKFKGDVASYSSDYQILEGRPINEKYILDFDRIVQTDQDVALVESMITNAPIGEDGAQVNPFTSFGRPEKGDILYKDSDNNGIINNDDRIMTNKNSTPDWTYGLSLGASWKGVDFGVLMQGAAGAYETFVNYNYSSSIRFGYQLNEDIVNGRYYEGRDVGNDPALYPRLLESSLSAKNNQRASTFWLANKSYWRIKNIQLGYTVPTELLEKANLASLGQVRIFGSLENYFTFTDWPGLDPEVSGMGYPVVKQALFGLNVTF